MGHPSFFSFFFLNSLKALITPFNRDAGDEDRQTEPDGKLRRREQEKESAVGNN